MNRRQAKKKLKAIYGFTVPRQANPKLTKRYMLAAIKVIKKRGLLNAG